MEAVNIWSTYLYGKLNEEIFMEQPEGFKILGSKNKVLCLKKALYGLKQAGLTWWNALNDSMKELGFEQIKSDPGIFLYKRKGSLMAVAIVYVDDAVFCGPSKAIIDKIKEHFVRTWSVKISVKPLNSYTCISNDMATKSTLINIPIWIRSLSALNCRMQTPLLHLSLRGITPFAMMGW